MDYIYAVLLLHKTKKEINEANLKSILTSAGVLVDDAKLKGLVATLKNINIDEAIAKASVVAVATPVAHETKKAEVKEEPVVTEESAAEGLSALFG